MFVIIFVLQETDLHMFIRSPKIQKLIRVSDGGDQGGL